MIIGYCILPKSGKPPRKLCSLITGEGPDVVEFFFEEGESPFEDWIVDDSISIGGPE